MKWAFMHRWYMPFVWITLSSLISVPVAIYLQNGLTLHEGAGLGLAHGDAWVLRDDFLATIVVYLLNLGALIWLFDGDGSTRWAAFWAGLAAAGKVAVPVTLATLSDVPVGINQHYVDWETLRVVVWFSDAQMFGLGLMLWLAFAHFVGEATPLVSHAPEYSHA